MTGATDQQTRTLEQIADLRRVLGAVAPGPERRRLAEVIRQLRFGLDVGIPKRRAAALLAISPQGLERWVAEGQVPTLRKPGSSRELLERDAFIRLLVEVRALREAGEQRPVAKAVRRLQERGGLRSSKPNQSARELRYEFLHSTGQERVRAAVALSRTAHSMASRAQARQTARP